MRIRWTPSAADDLFAIAAYLQEHHPELVRSTIVRLHESAQSLKALPNRGRIGRESGTRELVCVPLPYIIAYRASKDAVEILHIHHAAQLR